MVNPPTPKHHLCALSPILPPQWKLMVKHFTHVCAVGNAQVGHEFPLGDIILNVCV